MILLKKNKFNFAKVLDNLGYAYFKTNNPKAIALLNTSLKIRDSIGDDNERIASLMHLAEYYVDKEANLSIAYAKKAYQCAKSTNSLYDRLEALKFLIKSSTPQEAKKIAMYQIELSDSISIVQAKVKTQFAMLRLDSTETIKKYEAQKRQKYIYIALLIAVVLIASYIFNSIRKRNQEKIKTISYETETRIAKKIHDELANDVFNVLTYAESQNLNDPNKKETLLDNLDTIYNRTRNISRENSEIKTDSKFAQQLTDLLQQYQNDSVRVIIKEFSSINWNEIKKETKIAIYRVLQELMVNMKKHSGCSFVMLEFNNQKSHIEIQYKDNGKGVEMLKSKKGLQNAENRIHAIKGTITFDSETDKGFKVNVKIPK